MQLLGKGTLSVRAITMREKHGPGRCQVRFLPFDRAVCARNNPLSPYLLNRKKSRKKQQFAGECQLMAGLRAER